MQKVITTFFIVLALLACETSKTETKRSGKIKLKRGASEWISLKQEGSLWKAKSATSAIKMKKNGDNYLVKIGSDKYKIKKKGGGYKIYNNSGKLRFKIKKKSDKIKIMTSEDDKDPLVLKRKGDLYKIKKTGKKIGKISFNQNSKKVKLKYIDGNEICSVKLNKLSPAPVVCIMDYISENEKLILFTLLTSIK